MGGAGAGARPYRRQAALKGIMPVQRGPAWSACQDFKDSYIVSAAINHPCGRALTQSNPPLERATRALHAPRPCCGAGTRPAGTLPYPAGPCLANTCNLELLLLKRGLLRRFAYSTVLPGRGVVWQGAVGCGRVRWGVAWCGRVRWGAAWCGRVWWGAAWCGGAAGCGGACRAVPEPGPTL